MFVKWLMLMVFLSFVHRKLVFGWRQIKKLRSGVVIAGKTRQLKEVTFVADAPARALITGTKGHNAAKACTYCKIEGKYKDNRMTFSFEECLPRCDDRYRRFLESNQTHLTLLSSVVGVSTCVPPEYMHSVCLGVVNKLLNI